MNCVSDACALALALLLAAAVMPAHAQVYRCVGKDGRVTYSQTKPAAGSCGEAKVTVPASTGADAGGLMSYSKDLDKSHAAQAKDKQQAEKQAAEDARMCSQARARLAGLEQAGRIFTVDEKGERHYDSDAQRQAKIDAMKQVIAQSCH